VVFIGANSGVGFATAKVLANTSETFHVIVASRTLEKAQAAMNEITAAGMKGTLSAVKLNLTDEESIEKAVALVTNDFGAAYMSHAIPEQRS
jgi:NAD(P)-dependent dehydrogenase (short-subunit alcohol dehydrogenase family)